MRRVTFYLDDKEYRDLKVILALKGMSASEWLRSEMAKYVDQTMPQVPLSQITNLTPVPRRKQRYPTPKEFKDTDLEI